MLGEVEEQMQIERSLKIRC